jgi:membrane-bound lytic murein transglycosylase D
LSFAEKQALAGKPISSGTTAAAAQSTSSVGPAIPPGLVVVNTENELYTVRRGDTIWDIARLFEGVSVNDILKLNNLPNANRLRIGQQLKIPVGR